MKNNILKGLLSLIFIAIAIPAVSQDFMSIFFKSGKLRTFHFVNIEEIYVSNVGEDGSEYIGHNYQHIKTQEQEFVYDLAEIDSITFTKYSEIESKQNTKEALSTLLPKLEDCQTIADVQKQMEPINESEAIETVWTEGDVLYVKVQDARVIKFYFDQTVDINNESQVKLENLLPKFNKPNHINDINGNKRKAVVVNQQHFDRSTWRINQQNNFMYPLVAKLQEAGYNAKYVESPDLDFFYSEIFDNDIVFISTHGGYSEATGHSFLSGTELGELPVNASTDGFEDLMSENLNKIFEDARYANCIDELSVGYVKETRINNDGTSSLYWVAYVDMNEEFFRNTATGDFPSTYSIMFNAACHSLQDNHDLANIFIDYHNLGTYLGYTESNYYGQEAGCTLFSSMLDGVSADKAYLDLANHDLNLRSSLQTVVGTYKDEDITEFDSRGRVEKQYIASVEIVPDKFITTNRYITPVYTVELTPDKVQEMYDDNKSITLQSITTSLHPENIKMGFYWGDFETDGVTDVPASLHYKTLDTGKGSLVFSASINNLQPGKKYHYRAYTYDGLHYNYGDIYTFTIVYPDLAITANTLSLNTGETSTINITSGSGNYAVEIDEPSIATVSLSDITITVQGLHEGTATLTVTDTRSLQTAAITVYVTKAPTIHNGHEYVDLGLPSGTKWATCNVGASKPEDYGGYYAWGETEEKNEYYSSNYAYYNASTNKYLNIGNNISGTEYDVAHVKWGGEWRMPTKAEIDEILSSCTWSNTSVNGVKGHRVEGPNGNSIFLPWGGHKYDDTLANPGKVGYYWPSTTSSTSSVPGLYIYSTAKDFLNYSKDLGLTVRPVCSVF